MLELAAARPHCQIPCRTPLSDPAVRHRYRTSLQLGVGLTLDRLVLMFFKIGREREDMCTVIYVLDKQVSGPSLYRVSELKVSCLNCVWWLF